MKLKDWMEENNISIYDIARWTGYHPATIKRWMKFSGTKQGGPLKNETFMIIHARTNGQVTHTDMYGKMLNFRH